MIRGLVPLFILACLHTIAANELNCVENALTPTQQCGNYYLCANGENILMECPDDLHFNPITKECDTPANAKCQLNTRPSTGCKAINPGEAEFAPHSDCGKYYVCQGIIRTEMPCPSGLHFNTALNVCDWPERVDCQAAEITTEEVITEEVTEAEVTTEAEITTEGEVSKPNGTCRANNPGEAELAPHEDCSKFYYCLGSKLVEMNCPAGLNFNPSLNVCDWPENTTCKGPSGPTDEPETEAPATEEPAPEPTETEEPETEAPETQEPETEAPETEEPATEVPSRPTGECRANNPGEVEFAPHEDCGKYYVCQGTLLTEMNCPAGLHFNPALNVCDWPQSANCQGNSNSTETPEPELPETEEPETEAPETEAPETEEPETEAPGTEEPITEVPSRPTGECRANNPGEVEFAPHPDCGKYFVCQGTLLTEMSCPAGLHFNPALNVCDWPQSANCQGNSNSTETPEPELPETEEPETEAPETEEPETEEPETEAPETEAPVTEEPETEAPETEEPITEVPSRPTGECRANNPGEVEFAPHPDCGKYFVCQGTLLTEMSCPAGLHFNPALNVCDWPQSANCQGSSNSTETPEPELPETEESETEAPETEEPETEAPETEEPETEAPETEEPETEAPETEAPETEEPETEVPETEAPETEEPITEVPIRPTGECRANNPGEVEFAPHPDCGKYFVCQGTLLTEMSCPAGLHFNPAINVCDWPQSANCQGNSNSTETPETEAPETQEPETEEPETEVPETKEPETEEPETEAPVTEEPETEAPETEEPITEVPSRPTGECRANNPGEVEFAPHPDCGKYFVCQGTLLTEMSCPAGLHFNPALNVCDWPQSANCQGNSNSTETPETEAPETQEPETEEPETEVPETEAPETEEPETEAPVTEEPETEVPETEAPETEEPITEVPNRPTGECRANNPGEVEFAPHPDCGKYFVCQGTLLTEMSCPAGLHFNPALNVCDWPQSANCQGNSNSTETPETEAPETQEPETEAPDTDAPETEEPEPEPTQTDAPATEEPTTQEEVTNRPTGECRANNLGEVEFAPHPDCGKYYVCQGTLLTEMSCPAGLHFNPALNVCDWPQNANCQGSSGSTDEPETEAPETELPETEAPETEEPATDAPVTNTPNGKCRNNKPGEAEFAPHPNDCNKYYVCEGDNLTEMNCPFDLHFNPTLNVCDWPSDANCNAEPTEIPQTEEPETEAPETEEPETEIPETEAPSSPNGNCRANNPGEVEFAPHSSDCNKYYVCQGERLIEMNCPFDLHFNPVLNVCDWPEDSMCLATPTEAPEEPSTDEPAVTDEPAATDDPAIIQPNPSQCRANKLGEIEFAPHPTDCTKYYVCDLGQLIEMNCPFDLHFNRALNVCDWPNEDKCNALRGAIPENLIEA